MQLQSLDILKQVAHFLGYSEPEISLVPSDKVLLDESNWHPSLGEKVRGQLATTAHYMQCRRQNASDVYLRCFDWSRHLLCQGSLSQRGQLPACRFSFSWRGDGLFVFTKAEGSFATTALYRPGITSQVPVQLEIARIPEGSGLIAELQRGGGIDYACCPTHLQPEQSGWFHDLGTIAPAAQRARYRNLASFQRGLLHLGSGVFLCDRSGSKTVEHSVAWTIRRLFGGGVHLLFKAGVDFSGPLGFGSKESWLVTHHTPIGSRLLSRLHSIDALRANVVRPVQSGNHWSLERVAPLVNFRLTRTFGRAVRGSGIACLIAGAIAYSA